MRASSVRGFQGVALKHLVVGSLAGALTILFVTSRPEWSFDHRIWRATGDASLMLLYAALLAGPLAQFWPKLAAPLVKHRRELGIWFGLLALLHTVLILNDWVRWDVMRFLGYEFVPELGRLARMEPGFGLANLMGLVAVLISLALVATSGDWAVRRLGASAWKFLQYSSYTVFYLSALHSAYFLFMQFTQHFHKGVPDFNWFRYPFLILTLVLIGFQVAAFLRSVSREQAREGRRSS
jgi:sulfoxide reductase heme-binding subunit YedZ